MLERENSVEISVERASGKLPLMAQLGLLMGPFLSMIDSNIVNVALPDIAKNLNSLLTSAQWIISGYLLALSAGLAATSYLSKRFGKKPVYLVSLIGFTIGSAICSFAPTIQVLIAARVLQGLLGAPLIPIAMSMIFGGGENRREKDIPPALGLMLFLAPAIGPTIGGVLIHFFGWPSVFLINVPIGLVGFVAAQKIPSLLEDVGNVRIRLDIIGILALAGGLTLAFYGTINGPSNGWMSTHSWPYWLSGAALLILYVIWSLRTAQPALDIKLFREVRTALALTLCGLTSVIMFSIIVLVPMLMEDVQHISPLVAGITLFPQAIVTGIGTVVGTRLTGQYGVRRSAMLGMLLLTAGSVLLLVIEKSTPSWMTSIILIFRGLGIGLVIQPLLSFVLKGVGEGESSDANTLFNVFERLGGATGVALVVTFLQVREKQVSAISGFHETFLLLSGLALVGLLCTFLLDNRDNIEEGTSLTDERGVGSS